LERDETEGEDNSTVDNLSKKMVRSRALSRSLSLQSKTSYQSLQNEGTEEDNTAESVADQLGKKN
jgi:ATP-binding cassette subfamily A (ABC1) protein 5